MTPALIVKALAEPLKLSGNAICESRQGGDVNRLFNITDGEREFAVKWSAGESFTGVNKHAQFTLQHSLFRQGIAPEPVWLSPDCTLWAERWVTTDAEPANNANSEDSIILLAFALHTIHCTAIDAPPLCLEPRLVRYFESADLESSHPLAEALRNVIDSGDAQQPPAEQAVLCHNDLSLPHIVRTGAGGAKPVIVDWEYAASGNRYFDVASCAAINQLNDEAALRLYKHYAAVSGAAEEKVIFACEQQRRVVNVTAALWQAALETTNRQKVSEPE